MATGTGTGTPVTSNNSITLNTLRDRIRTQLSHASGFTEPEVVTASSITLAQLRDRVEAFLQDSGNTKWSTDDLDEAIRQALGVVSEQDPARAITTLTVSAAGREIDISSITGLLRVEKVWWDYDSSTPGYPPNWRQFEVWPGQLLYIDDRDAPAVDDVIRIWYTKKHTINGLDSETTTTINADDVDFIVQGAAHFAARSRAIELSEELNVDRDVVDNIRKWADETGVSFRYWIRQRPPAWQRYAYAYDQGDIDEAIRWALHRYNEVNPDQTITTITLSSDGREVDISSITDYQEIVRVWWPYTSSDPEYNPEWVDFQVWPGDILFIDTDTEPSSSEVVRIWYTKSRTVNGLDSASTTTLPVRDETLLVTGATGFAAQERIQENPSRSVPRKLREWAQERLREFEHGLARLARREAARHSGIAPLAALDRWDSGGDKW